MSPYLVGITCFILGILTLGAGIILFLVVRSINGFRVAIVDLTKSIDPVLGDKRLADTAAAIQTIGATIPDIIAQLKSLNVMVGKFYGVAMTNSTTAPAVPAAGFAGTHPAQAPQDESAFYAYSELTAAALEKKAEYERRTSTKLDLGDEAPQDLIPEE